MVYTAAISGATRGQVCGRVKHPENIYTGGFAVRRFHSRKPGTGFRLARVASRAKDLLAAIPVLREAVAARTSHYYYYYYYYYLFNSASRSGDGKKSCLFTSPQLTGPARASCHQACY